MSLALQKADAFLQDFALQALWYVRQAGDEVARSFQQAVESRLRSLCEQPGLGGLRRFSHPAWRGMSLRIFQGLDDRFGARALLVAFQEKLRTDHAVGSDNKGAGIRYPAGASRCFFVTNAIRVDRFAASV